MRESLLTAGASVALPVIAQGWFCGKRTVARPGRAERFCRDGPGRLPKRFPKRASVVGNPGVAASSETVSHSGTANRGARLGRESTSVWTRYPVRKPEEQKRCKANLQNPVESAGKAEAGFALVNAVRVAGPDRILFWVVRRRPWVVGRTPHPRRPLFAVTSSVNKIGLFCIDIRLLFAYTGSALVVFVASYSNLLGDDSSASKRRCCGCKCGPARKIVWVRFSEGHTRHPQPLCAYYRFQVESNISATHQPDKLSGDD